MLKKILIIGVAVYVLALVLGFSAYKNVYLAQSLKGTQNYLASVFFTQSITVSDLKQKYLGASTTEKKVRILIVPGHEPDYGGAEYKNLKERDLNVEMAEVLKDKLSADTRFEIILSRDKNDWNPEIKKYFTEHWADIIAFKTSKKTTMKSLLNSGQVAKVSDGLKHNAAPDDVAIRLFGLNKWANENGVDIMLHVHFNDNPRANDSKPGDYRGFAIYVPDKQYSNSKATQSLALSIFKELNRSFAVSNLPKENAGIIPNQDLIALGQSNSVDGVSLLIEYGYLYRDTFINLNSRQKIFDELGKETYIGIENFFN